MVLTLKAEARKAYVARAKAMKAEAEEEARQEREAIQAEDSFEEVK